ncbi:MAG: ABC transporter ATP-binding protein [Actinomycetota bacterium]|nr:ABC transporter ATP-binding protein [Actinomycetota bacterium]
MEDETTIEGVGGARYTEGLSVASLTKRFGATTAVDDLGFVLRPGDVLGLLGPNGAGKTTTLSCLAGLLRPDSGEVTWRGLRVDHSRPRPVALIPETPEVYRSLTVWQHLVFVARSCRLPEGWKDRGEQLLEDLGLVEFRSRLGHTLSKGLRQRCLIASAVLAGTPVLALDEPMIGLDPAGQRQLRDLIVHLSRTGVAIVLSTHLLESAEQLCNRLLIMKNGRMVAEDTLDALKERHGQAGLEEMFLELTR